MSKKSLVNLENSRRGTYAKVIEKIIKDKVCPFCMENFLKYHTKPILKTGKHWLVTKNFQPYAGSKTHLLFVHKKHLGNLEKVSNESWKELMKLHTWSVKKFNLPGCTMLLRSGNTDYTGGSVNHIHAQLVSGISRTKKPNRPIQPIIGFGKK